MDQQKTEEQSVRKRIGRAIGETAPTIAGALGGPLAGAAVDALSRAIFGREVNDDTAIEEIVLAQSPDSLAAIRRAEIEFRRAVLDADNEGLRISASDRANARARQIALKDMTPTVMGIVVIGGFFYVLSIMFGQELPPGTETEFSIMLGALATMTAAVVNYFFGSTAGSREKTKLMADQRR